MNQHKIIAAIRALWGIVVYPLRAVLPLFVLYLFLLSSFQSRINMEADPLASLSLICELDLLRVLFYALLPVGLLFMLAGARRNNGPLWSGKAALLSLAGGLLTLYLPQRGLDFTRPGLDLPPGYQAASIILGLNAALFLYFHVAGCWDERVRRAIRRMVVVADLFAPLLVWAAYRAQRGRWVGPLRLLPSLFVCGLLVAPWLVDPAPLKHNPRLDPQLIKLAALSPYQVMVAPQRDKLIICADDQRLYLVDAYGRGLLAERKAPTPFIQAVAYEKSTDELVFADPYEGHLLRLDWRTLKTTLDTSIADHPLNMEGNFPWRTLLLGENRVFSYCAEWMGLMDQGGRQFRFAAILTQADALFDETAAEIYLTGWYPGRLVSLSSDDLSEKFSLPLPGMPERLALDRVGRRLFVTMPLNGQVAVIDPDHRVELERITAFPGVRVAAIDQPRNLLLLAGFSPVLEIRDLQDFSLIARMTAPSWMRWIELDEERGRAYLSSCLAGVYALDLDSAANPGWRDQLKRYDPFYALASLTARLLLNRLGLL
ncbi:MAG: hypothetical protein P9M14_17175 [Candidatus Alcyoniella australis]|nr:hypothetical protein [Candidatus Alcyoniella australis]